MASLVAQLIKNLPAMWETWVQSLFWGRSPGEGNGYPLRYSGLENSMDCTVSEVAESDMTERLSNLKYWTLSEPTHGPYMRKGHLERHHPLTKMEAQLLVLLHPVSGFRIDGCLWSSVYAYRNGFTEQVIQIQFILQWDHQPSFLESAQSWLQS